MTKNIISYKYQINKVLKQEMVVRALVWLSLSGEIDPIHLQFSLYCLDCLEQHLNSLGGLLTSDHQIGLKVLLSV